MVEGLGWRVEGACWTDQGGGSKVKGSGWMEQGGGSRVEGEGEGERPDFHYLWNLYYSDRYSFFLTFTNRFIYILLLYLYVCPRSTPILCRIAHTFIAYTHTAHILDCARQARHNPYVGHRRHQLCSDYACAGNQ